MNRYKIDWNEYSSDIHPYALYGKRPWSWFDRGWEHIASFDSKEKAAELHRKLIGLPIYLDN